MLSVVHACLPARSSSPCPSLLFLGECPPNAGTNQPANPRHVAMSLYCCFAARSLALCGASVADGPPGLLFLRHAKAKICYACLFSSTRRKTQLCMRKRPAQGRGKRRAMPFVCLDICCCCCTPGKRKRSCLSKAWRGIYKGLRECACGRSLRTKWVLWCDQGRVFVQGQVDEANRQLFHALGAAQKSEQWKRRLCRACGRRLRNPSRWNG